MTTSTSAIERSATADVSGQDHKAAVHTRRWFFRVSAVALCGIGVLVILLSRWLVWDTEAQPAGRSGDPVVELQMLQPLVTGNLAVFLSWVWLDLRAPRRDEKDADARFGLLLVTAAVAGVMTLMGAAGTPLLLSEAFLPFALCVVVPMLVTVVPLLWFAARRMERSWSRALLLAGVVVAGAMVQRGHTAGNDAELRVFTANSCLIGLAVVVWLLTWAATSEPRRTP